MRLKGVFLFLKLTRVLLLGLGWALPSSSLLAGYDIIWTALHMVAKATLACCVLPLATYYHDLVGMIQNPQP